MDRNQFTGLILMFALLVVYFVFFAPEAPPPPTDEQVTEQIASDSSTIQTEQTTTEAYIEPSTTLPDSVLQMQRNSKYGSLAFAAAGDVEMKQVSNENLEITFSNKGGKIESVRLLGTNDYLGNPLEVMRKEASNYDYALVINGNSIGVSELTFAPEVKEVNDTTVVAYSIKNNGLSLTHEYRIPKEGFEVFHSIRSTGLNGIMAPNDVVLNWNHRITRAEKNLEDARYNSNVRYYLKEGEYDQLKERSVEFEEEQLNSPVHWFAFKQKFFNVGLIADKQFNAAYVTSNVDNADTTSVKELSARVSIPYTDFLNGFDAKFYFGPNKYEILKQIAPDYSENLDMGWGPLPFINKFLIIPIFHFFERHLTNYGIIILLVVLVIRLILSPLTYRSHISMAKMRVMKPELDELKSKHKDDMQKAQQEQMQLYQKVGINPLSGCIPQLLMMPILFSLFFFFPNAVELRQQSFLWAKDLSTYDSIITFGFEIPFYGDHVSLFTLLMTISTLLITKVNSQQMSNIEGPMKTIQYMMPIMFLFVLNNYASGLTFYYFVSNMATYGQTLLFRKIVDEDKIKRVLDENRKKNKDKKKSRFQTRLEEAMKASQEAQKNQKKKK